MSIQLPPLPYGESDLAPHISANTLSFHYGKHHQAYVTNLNGLIKDGPLASKSLEDIIKATAGKADQVKVFGFDGADNMSAMSNVAATDGSTPTTPPPTPQNLRVN